jgi:hypothetical protein
MRDLIQTKILFEGRSYMVLWVESPNRDEAGLQEFACLTLTQYINEWIEVQPEMISWSGLFVRAGLSPATCTAWRKGELREWPRRKTLNRLSVAMGFDVDHLAEIAGVNTEIDTPHQKKTKSQRAELVRSLDYRDGTPTNVEKRLVIAAIIKELEQTTGYKWAIPENVMDWGD